MTLWQNFFQFNTFLSAVLCEFRCTKASGPSSTPCNSFLILFLYSVFLFLLFTYPCLELFALLCIQLFIFIFFLRQLVSSIFFPYFGRSCFALIAWFCSDIFWVFLLSPIHFDLLLPFVLLVCWDIFLVIYLPFRFLTWFFPILIA